MAVLQWNAIIALNYTAKDKGIKRHLKIYEALDICPELVLVHVETIIDGMLSYFSSSPKQVQVKSRTRNKMSFLK